MKRFNERVTIEYLKRLSPHHVSAAEDFLTSLPTAWQAGIPKPCTHNDGTISKPAVAHALLWILDPVKFPASRCTRLLADYMQEIRLTYFRPRIHHQQERSQPCNQTSSSPTTP